MDDFTTDYLASFRAALNTWTIAATKPIRDNKWVLGSIKQVENHKFCFAPKQAFNHLDNSYNFRRLVQSRQQITSIHSVWY